MPLDITLTLTDEDLERFRQRINAGHDRVADHRTILHARMPGPFLKPQQPRLAPETAVNRKSYCEPEKSVGRIRCEAPQPT